MQQHNSYSEALKSMNVDKTLTMNLNLNLVSE